MVKHIVGDVFESIVDVAIVPTNSFVKRNGELVMGAGAALAMKELHPPIAKEFGKTVKERGHLGFYGSIIRVYRDIETNEFRGGLGALQTKFHFKDKSTLLLIKDSLESLLNLVNIVEEFEERSFTYGLVYPGIGNGGLHRLEVAPLLEVLPDSFTVFRLPDAEKMSHM